MNTHTPWYGITKQLEAAEQIDRKYWPKTLSIPIEEIFELHQSHENLVLVLELVLNSDMAMREEDEGRVSRTLESVRTALAMAKATQEGE